MEDQILIKKQELLKTEIIEKNYDKDLFLEYCISQKDNGDDLNSWNIDELKVMISKFQNMSLEKNEITNIKEDLTEIKIEPNITVDKINIYKTQNDEKYLEKEIMCKKIDPTVINNISIDVVIKNPKLIEGGFFSSSYISYEVNTIQMSWLVRRRFSDFYWLRSVLIKIFPAYIVPPLPNKKTGSRRFEEDFIEKRMKFLQNFLSIICQNEYFKSSECLILFLSQTDRVVFDTKMKEFNNFNSPNYIEDIRTFEGKVSILDNEENEKCYTNINNYFYLQKTLLDRLNISLKNFYISMKNAAINLEEVSKDFQNLYTLNSKVLMKDDILICYNEMDVFFRNWKKILNNQNTIIKDNIKEFLKYVNMENTTYYDIIRDRDDLKSKYNNELLRLNLKKEKLWTHMEVNKFDLNEEGNIDRSKLLKDKNYAFNNMCYKETNLLNNLHNKLGYINKMCLDELKRLINIQCVRYKENFKNFADVFYPTLTDGINVWSNLITNLSTY